MIIELGWIPGICIALFIIAFTIFGVVAIFLCVINMIFKIIQVLKRIE